MHNPFDKHAFHQAAIAVDTDFLKSITSCLIMVPHPDDESLGCGGLIALLRQQNCRVTIVVTTDGSQSHPNSVKFPKGDRIAIRKQEIEMALSVLMVSPKDIHFMNGKDAALPVKEDPDFFKYKNLLKEILVGVKPQLCLVPYELDPHCDHRATWQLLNSALSEIKNNGITVWEYPIWLYALAKPEDIPQLQEGELKYVEISSYLPQKTAAIHTHVSQITRLIDDDPEGFLLTADMIENFLTGKEYFLERATLQKEKTLSADYFQSLYQQTRDPWNFEASDYERQKYQTTLDFLPDSPYPNALEIGCSIGVLTSMLRTKCSHLLSIDISDTALQVAKERLKDYLEVEFEVRAIPHNFPDGNYDLVVMSEVGYYLSMPDLLLAKDKIVNSLVQGGTLILVHWTHYVVDYPLTGDQVHEVFLKDDRLLHKSFTRTTDYRLDVFTLI
ncbi:bifunctional PIG-L family deacetylase/class I SAM-dependent methyltransferase [Mucilaginibacter galii]|nr:bifunctional PIG-L family deacetylase/class I SAM-dependent methyltransferase [Mucilaginibacter galii]